MALMLTILFAAVSCNKEQELVDQDSTKNDNIKKVLKKYGHNEVRFVEFDNPEFDFDKALKFESIEEFESFTLKKKSEINNQKGGIPITHVDNEGSGTNSEGVFTVVKPVAGYLSLYYNLSFNFEGCQPSGAHTWLTGFTFSLKYTNTTRKITKLNSAIAYYVAGVVDTYLIIDGSPVISSHNISMSGITQCG